MCAMTTVNPLAQILAERFRKSAKPTKTNHRLARLLPQLARYVGANPFQGLPFYPGDPRQLLFLEARAAMQLPLRRADDRALPPDWAWRLVGEYGGNGKALEKTLYDGHGNVVLTVRFEGGLWVEQSSV